MSMSKKKRKFVFPDKLLDEINECSAGGYILFVFDEYGNPEIYNKFDDAVAAMAMQYYIDNWAKAIEALNVESMANSLHKKSNKRGKSQGGEEDPPSS